MLPTFPFGSDFDEVEQQLLPALGWLKEQGATWRGRLALAKAFLRPGEVAAGEAVALERMQLADPRSVGDRLQRRLVLAALRRSHLS